MNKKNIDKKLNAKLKDWIKSIDDESVVNAIKENVLITGGALVSLINNEEPNDYDIYFKTQESCFKVAEYYATKWNLTHKKNKVEILKSEHDNRVECFIKSSGVAVDENTTPIDDATEPNIAQSNIYDDQNDILKYKPRYFSTNAISLSDKIQIVVRFVGDVESIHKNYDFLHCTCSYDWNKRSVSLPTDALMAIINKELIYCGSKYPLCSIIRSRKFINRGYTISAGQYVKMALQLNELDLLDFNTFKEQITGVDSAYFSQIISILQNDNENNINFKLDTTYLIELINKYF